jgi:hypothetical protein
MPPPVRPGTQRNDTTDMRTSVQFAPVIPNPVLHPGPQQARASRTAAQRRGHPYPYSSALQVRRWAVIFAAFFSGLLVFVSMLVDPAPDASGAELIRAYAAHPMRQGVHTNLIHYGFALFAPVAFALVGLVRGRGAWLANAAGLLSVIGLTTLPGLVLIDYHDIATAHVASVELAVAASDGVAQLPGFLPLLLPALVCSLLALPLAAAAAWRARLLQWWVPLALVVSFGVMRVLPGRLAFGLLALATAGLAYALWRIPAHRWFGAPHAREIGPQRG